MTKSLVNLLNELIAKIFGFTDRVDQAVKLSTTCRRLRAIWESNAPFILDVLLAKETYFYEWGKVLAEEERKLIGDLPDDSSEDIYKRKMCHAKRVLTNNRDILYVTKWASKYYLFSSIPPSTVPTLAANLYLGQLFLVALYSEPIKQQCEEIGRRLALVNRSTAMNLAEALFFLPSGSRQKV